MSLRAKRLRRERMVVEDAVARGDVVAAVWAEDLEKVEASEIISN
jgi:hypothetical protein